MREIRIADRTLGDGHPPFIVAEVGMNHNGSVSRALKMVRAARNAGCDSVKFGTFKADEFCAKSDPLYATFKSCELPDDAWYEIKAEADREGITFFSTPQNKSDLDLLLKVGVPCVKIGSDDLTNLELIRSYWRTGLPMILSTGMADAVDIGAALAESNAAIVCVCTSEYPCPPEHANLSRIRTMRKEFDVLTGFSDHTEGYSAGMIARALGASYFEKHFTLDKHAVGPDHSWSADALDLQQWCDMIRHVDVLLGTGRIEPTEQERVNRVHWRRKSGQQIRGAA